MFFVGGVKRVFGEQLLFFALLDDQLDIVFVVVKVFHESGLREFLVDALCFVLLDKSAFVNQLNLLHIFVPLEPIQEKASSFGWVFEASHQLGVQC